MSQEVAESESWGLLQYVGPDLPGRDRTRFQLSYANDRQSRHLDDIGADDLDELRRLLNSVDMYRPVGEPGA